MKKLLFLLFLISYCFLVSCSKNIYCIKLKEGGAIYTEYYEYDEHGKMKFIRPTVYSKFDYIGINKIDTIYMIKVKDIK